MIPQPSQAPAISASIWMEKHSGPIPHPSILARYEELAPGAARDLIDLSIEQARHRMSCETKVVDEKISARKQGMACGLAVALSAFAVSAYFGHLTLQTAAIWAALSPVCGLVATFVVGKRNEREELKVKRESLAARSGQPKPAKPIAGKPGDDSTESVDPKPDEQE